MKMWVSTAAALCCAMTCAAQSTKEGFPARQPIRLVVGTAAGAGPDVIARLLAEKMAPLLQQAIVIDNRAGAAGTIAGQHVARAQPDGYTVLLGSTSFMVLNVALNPKLAYDPVKDFVPLGQVGTSSIVLVASNDYPASNLTELMAHAKAEARPGQFASWGGGSSGHFCGEILNKLGGLQLQHVPYKTTSQVVNGILGGQIQLGFVDNVTAIPFVSTRKVKALGTCPTALPVLPGVQSYGDAGLAVDATFWWGLFVPAGVPTAVTNRWSTTLETVLKMPDVRDRLIGLGLNVTYTAGPELNASMARDIVFWKGIVRSANMSAE